MAQAVTTLRSSASHVTDINLYLLLLDEEQTMTELKAAFPDIVFLVLSGLPTTEVERINKYTVRSDAFRWSLKPVLLKKILNDTSTDEILYCDNDIFFFQPFNFLFKEFSRHDILLFPHWRINHPLVDKDWFETNFKDGIFNGGCIGVSKKATEFLNWWAECCAYRCEINFSDGLYVDQKYLDMVPALFERSHIVRHKGCNVAYWNIRSLPRSLKNQKVIIDEKEEVVFAHFTGDYLRVLKNGEDFLMKPLAESYLEQLKNTQTILQSHLNPP